MRGLYAITPETLDTARLVEQVCSAIAGGATVVQYRYKQIGDNLAKRQAEALRQHYDAHTTRFAERAEARVLAHAPKVLPDKKTLLADILARAKERT